MMKNDDHACVLIFKIRIGGALWSTMEQIELAHSIFSCWWSHKTPWPGSDPKSYPLGFLNGCTSLSLGRGPRELYWEFEKAISQYPYLGGYPV